MFCPIGAIVYEYETITDASPRCKLRFICINTVLRFDKASATAPITNHVFQFRTHTWRRFPSLLYCQFENNNRTCVPMVAHDYCMKGVQLFDLFLLTCSEVFRFYFRR